MVRREGLSDKIHVESRGTGPWHIGEEPDARSQAMALNFGIDISDLRGRQFSPYDFEQFDLILVMDESNHRDVLHLTKDEVDRAKVDFLLSYLEPAQKNVPDPYQGGTEGFRRVFQMIEKACLSLLDEIKLSL